MVTAYAGDRAIERAFAAGAYDYLEKNRHFEALLKAKVRAALAAPRERRLQSERKEETMVVPLDTQAIEDLLASRDRNEQLKAMLDQAVLAANGGRGSSTGRSP